MTRGHYPGSRTSSSTRSRPSTPTAAATAGSSRRRPTATRSRRCSTCSASRPASTRCRRSSRRVFPRASYFRGGGGSVGPRRRGSAPVLVSGPAEGLVRSFRSLGPPERDSAVARPELQKLRVVGGLYATVTRLQQPPDAAPEPVERRNPAGPRPRVDGERRGGRRTGRRALRRLPAAQGRRFGRRRARAGRAVTPAPRYVTAAPRQPPRNGPRRRGRRAGGTKAARVAGASWTTTGATGPPAPRACPKPATRRASKGARVALRTGPDRLC